MAVITAHGELDAAMAVEPLSTSRREKVCRFIVFSSNVVAPQAHPLSARQRSGGRWSHTDAPGGMFSAAGACTRNWVPSGISTR